MFWEYWYYEYNLYNTLIYRTVTLCFQNIGTMDVHIYTDICFIFSANGANVYNDRLT